MFVSASAWSVISIISLSLIWIFLAARKRKREYHVTADQLGFQYLGTDLPSSLDLKRASFWDSWDRVTNVIRGMSQGVETVVFYFHANHGELSYEQTTVAMRSNATIVPLSGFWQASGIVVERAGDWLLMFRPKEVVPTAELAGFVKDCRGLLDYLTDCSVRS